MSFNLSEALREGFNSEYRPHTGTGGHRGYLGMSMVGGCPAAAYDSYFGTRPVDQRLLWYGWVGRALESGLVDILNISAVVIPQDHFMYSIEADFDSRYRGHPDIILLAQGDLHVIDVKSVDWAKFEEFLLRGNVPYSHEKNIAQIQSYMKHGDFSRGHIVYTPRDIPHNAWPENSLVPECDRAPMPYCSMEVYHDPAMQDSLDAKAVCILNAIDTKLRPGCTCGWCPNPSVPEEDEVPF